MKNIIITGVGRAGKTTMSNMIKNVYKEYNVIHSDCIKWGIIRGKGMEAYYRKNISKQKKFEHSKTFQKTLIEIYTSLIRQDKENYGYILETGQLEIEYIHKYIDKKDIVVCLGLGKLKENDMVEMCKKNDTINDWSYDCSYEQLYDHAKQWNKTNIKLIEDCKKYKVKYFDMSQNRLQMLDEVFNYIEKELLN